MQVDAARDFAAVADRAELRWRIPRLTLALLTASAVAGGGVLLASGSGTTLDPDLARVMRFMAAMKGGFALAAFAGCFWRLARPAGLARTVVYVAAPPCMAFSALGLLALRDLGIAALLLHVGLFAVLAAALTDTDFLPDLAGLRRRRR